MSDPRLLMATVHDPEGGGDEAEPVLIQTDGEVVHLTLEDGRDLAMSRGELEQALAA